MKKLYIVRWENPEIRIQEVMGIYRELEEATKRREQLATSSISTIWIDQEGNTVMSNTLFQNAMRQIQENPKATRTRQEKSPYSLRVWELPNGDSVSVIWDNIRNEGGVSMHYQGKDWYRDSTTLWNIEAL